MKHTISFSSKQKTWTKQHETITQIKNTRTKKSTHTQINPHIHIYPSKASLSIARISSICFPMNYIHQARLQYHGYTHLFIFRWIIYTSCSSTYPSDGLFVHCPYFISLFSYGLHSRLHGSKLLQCFWIELIILVPRAQHLNTNLRKTRKVLSLGYNISRLSRRIKVGQDNFPSLR